MSFIISLSIHAIVLLLASYILKFKEEELVELSHGPSSHRSSKNIIDIQFGSETNKVNKNVKSKKIKTSQLLKSSGPDFSSSTIEKDSGTFGTSTFETSIKFFKEPIYPKLAIKRNLEGAVKLTLKISDEGVPLEVIVSQSSGHVLLDEAAKEAAIYWRFHERPMAGQYVVEKTVLFKFRD